MIKWESRSWWQKILLVMLAESLWMFLISLAFSFAVWDFSALFTWSLVRFIVAVWIVTLLVMGCLKCYEISLENEARKKQ